MYPKHTVVIGDNFTYSQYVGKNNCWKPEVSIKLHPKLYWKHSQKTILNVVTWPPTHFTTMYSLCGWASLGQLLCPRQSCSVTCGVNNKSYCTWLMWFYVGPKPRLITYCWPCHLFMVKNYHFQTSWCIHNLYPLLIVSGFIAPRFLPTPSPHVPHSLGEYPFIFLQNNSVHVPSMRADSSPPTNHSLGSPVHFSIPSPSPPPPWPSSLATPSVSFAFSRFCTFSTSCLPSPRLGRTCPYPLCPTPPLSWGIGPFSCYAYLLLPPILPLPSSGISWNTSVSHKSCTFRMCVLSFFWRRSFLSVLLSHRMAT